MRFSRFQNVFVALFILCILPIFCFCDSAPSSIVVFVSNNETTSINSSGKANITYGLADNTTPNQAGYKWNVSFVLEYPNRTLSRGGSVASVGCDADGGGRASFTTEVNAAGVYALHAYVSYLFPQEGHNCSDGGTFDNQTEVVTTNFLVQNTPSQSGLASSVVTTTLSLPVAPTGHVQGSSGSSGQSIISTVSLERLGPVWTVLAIGMMMVATI